MMLLLSSSFVQVWSTAYPSKVLFRKDMKEYKWRYTQFSQFNTTDELLLVSGVHEGELYSGEIVVFNMHGKSLF